MPNYHKTLLASLLLTFSSLGFAANFIKASYIQVAAIGSLGSIPASAYAASNIILFAFADTTTSSTDSSILSAMQTAINSETAGTINLLSIGGETATPATINSSTAASILSNICAQITAYNSQLTGGKISGVDLDLENGIDANTISLLAQGFKAKGLLVSVAPQVYLSSGTNVDPSNPSNLTLTSGLAQGANNQYAAAIASGNVDYIMAQTYNTGSWTINNTAENQVQFFQNSAAALNNVVQQSCPANGTTLCIPSTTKIVIGEPSNAGASGTVNNIYGSSGSSSYNQASILSSLASEWSNVQTSYPNISGIMQWSLNNDYDPTGWGDSNASAGAFSSTIYGAPISSGPYFILQVSNTGSSTFDSATIVVNGQYWVFGTAGGTSIAPNANQLWGTLASSKNPATPTVVDSSNLDSLFSAGQKSFSSASIIINSYANSNQPLSQPTNQYVCSQGTNYVFQAGHSYNVMLNADLKTCSVQQVS